MLMIQYTHEDVNRIFMQNLLSKTLLDPWNPLESFPCCYRNASDLHFYPVHDRRFCQQEKPSDSLIKNQVPGYTTALGTQSSAATIPVNLQCAEADGVCSQIRNFVVPLCANIHMAGSMITITACATAVCLMNQLPISLATVIPFIMTLGIAMVASPELLAVPS